MLWNGTSALAPLNQKVPEGLTLVPVEDRPPNHLVVAWKTATHDPLVRSFIDVAEEVFDDRRSTTQVRASARVTDR